VTQPPQRQPISISDALGDPASYVQAIQKIYGNRARRHNAFADAFLGVTYFSTYLNQRSLARTLARAVRKGDYVCSPVDQWTLHLGNKSRLAVAPCFTDQVLGSVVFDVLRRNIEAAGLPGVYSYLPGTSNYDAMRRLSDFLRACKKRVPDRRRQGLYVLQSDFKGYGDNLPVHPGAPIWSQLREVIGQGSGGVVPDPAWRIVESLVRPVVRDADGAEFVRMFGTPMGAPLTPMIHNLAAKPLDDLLVNWEGGFYARYNDDFVFAHPDLSQAIEADRRIEAVIAPLGIARNLKKDIRTYLNGAGRPCPMGSHYAGRHRIDLLGFSVDFDGGMAVGPKRTARLFARICKRLDRAAHIVDDLAVDDRARHLVGAANTLLDGDNPFCAPGIKSFRLLTTDRGVLKDMDNRIARKIVQLATGRPGMRGFRDIPPHELRTRWGLISLLASRNAAGQ